MSDIIQLIQSVGFPVAACIAMGLYVKDVTNKNDERIDKLNDTHNKALDKITTALNNNTIALTKLSERLGDTDDE